MLCSTCVGVKVGVWMRWGPAFSGGGGASPCPSASVSRFGAEVLVCYLATKVKPCCSAPVSGGAGLSACPTAPPAPGTVRPTARVPSPWGRRGNGSSSFPPSPPRTGDSGLRHGKSADHGSGTYLVSTRPIEQLIVKNMGTLV